MQLWEYHKSKGKLRISPCNRTEGKVAMVWRVEVWFDLVW